ncbi:DUF2536 family protein [Peribacillus sp. B-H-3]|jgi:hypothetical protein|uniref:DUF2536 family protein n=1 Tax=Bacillaceae TaxID=186817 RepID=UPI0008F5A191|nr:DUF2536 family protein [Bacillus sp. MUM 13]OIK13311.1 hypothetical protein BIV59_06010 [Bacillus sp. MUM 13]
MNFQLDFIQDKVEFFEAESLKDLEKKVEAQIEVNKAILLGVHAVSHQMHVTEEGRRFYSAVVHFKAKA